MLERGPIQQTIEAKGNIQAVSEARLSFQQGGVISRVVVTLGDGVKKGDVLAELDKTDLELAARQSQAQLTQSQNNVRNAEQAIIVAHSNVSRTLEGSRKGDLDAAQAALDSATANYTRVTSGQGSDIAAAQAAYTAAKANYDRVTVGQQSDVAAAQAAYDAAVANLAKVQAGATESDLAGVKAQFLNAEAAVKKAQAEYDRAYRGNPAGIGAHPSALALEQATNNFNLAKSSYDKVVNGFDDAQRRAAEQQVAGAKASLDRFGGSVQASNRAAAEQQVKSARASLDRFGGANDASNKAAAWQQVQAAQANLDKLKEPARSFDITQVQAQLEQANIALANAKTSVELNEVVLAQARRRLDQTQLRAPFDGVVGSVNIKDGESTNTQAVAVVLADPARFYMDVTVDELDVSQLRQGQGVIVAADALPGIKLSGSVERIASTSTRLNGVVSYNVRVSLPGAAALKSGMSAIATIVLASKPDALLAPAEWPCGAMLSASRAC